jgi:uncharacterized protein with NAD-binding domain and iron-sulfur cluster
MATVAILGGGVAGLSAAHELMERGFTVSVYERRTRHWGGKARSVSKPNSATGGRKDLPGEHGFRFFPGFYKHLPDTMKRIPYPGNPQGVFDNLVSTNEIGLWEHGGPSVVLPAHWPTAPRQWRAAIHDVIHAHAGVPFDEAAFFADQLMVILTSCQARRLAVYEGQTWWDFMQADKKSLQFQKFLAVGLTRSLVAMKPKDASTRTIGDILLQLVLNMITPGSTADRVLCGPTNDVWIDPWVAFLTQRGVQMHLDARTVALNCDGRTITSATVQSHTGQATTVQADYYICAFPVEVLQPLITDAIRTAAPSLARLGQLRTEWMNGIQFYLNSDVPIEAGHSVYLDSAWGISSISQRQYWSNVDLAQFGDGQVRGLISLDICDWTTPGDNKPPAEQCTRDQIKEEVWAELKAHVNSPAAPPMLEDANLHDWNLDPDITFPRSGAANDDNREPLLINTTHSWQNRPEASVEIPNLFLASDYVRTYTDLATMEGANEAARRAVNAILKRAGSAAPPCTLWPLQEPGVLAPLRWLDWVLFKLGLPHVRVPWPF